MKTKRKNVRMDLDTWKELRRMKRIWEKFRNESWSFSDFVWHLMERVKKDHPEFYD